MGVMCLLLLTLI